jgi:hypothetical protein
MSYSNSLRSKYGLESLSDIEKEQIGDDGLVAIPVEPDPPRDENLHSIEKRGIAEVFKKLPPNSFYLKHPETLLDSIKQRWIDIGKGIDAYFSGEADPFPTHWEKYYKKFIEHQVSEYLSLYDVLFWGWDDIKSAAKRQKIKLPSTRMAALKAILRGECDAQVHCGLHHADFDENLYRTVENLRNFDTISPVQKNKLRAKDRGFIPISKQDQFLGLKDFCVSAVECAVRSTPNRRNGKLKRCFDNYLIIRSEYWKEVSQSYRNTRTVKLCNRSDQFLGAE